MSSAGLRITLHVWAGKFESMSTPRITDINIKTDRYKYIYIYKYNHILYYSHIIFAYWMFSSMRYRWRAFSRPLGPCAPLRDLETATHHLLPYLSVLHLSPFRSIPALDRRSSFQSAWMEVDELSDRLMNQIRLEGPTLCGVNRIDIERQTENRHGQGQKRDECRTACAILYVYIYERALESSCIIARDSRDL